MKGTKKLSDSDIQKIEQEYIALFREQEYDLMDALRKKSSVPFPKIDESSLTSAQRNVLPELDSLSEPFSQYSRKDLDFLIKNEYGRMSEPLFHEFVDNVSEILFGNIFPDMYGDNMNANFEYLRKSMGKSRYKQFANEIYNNIFSLPAKDIDSYTVLEAEYSMYEFESGIDLGKVIKAIKITPSRSLVEGKLTEEITRDGASVGKIVSVKELDLYEEFITQLGIYAIQQSMDDPSIFRKVANYFSESELNPFEKFFHQALTRGEDVDTVSNTVITQYMIDSWSKVLTNNNKNIMLHKMDNKWEIVRRNQKRKAYYSSKGIDLQEILAR